MSRSINQVQEIFFVSRKIFHLNCMTLDRNSPFPLNIHIIKHLILKISAGKCTGFLEQPVSYCALSMINVSDYTKVPYVFHFYKANTRIYKDILFLKYKMNKKFLKINYECNLKSTNLILSFINKHSLYPL